MQVAYLKGEKVYVERVAELDPRATGKDKFHLFSDQIQIVKHAEIVRAFNCMFQYVDDHPDEIGDDLQKIIRDINLLSRHDNHKIHVDVSGRESTYFDDERKVKLVQRAKQAKLMQEDKVTFDHKIKLIKGGLGTEETPIAIATDGTHPATVEPRLSKEFLAFKREQHPNPDHYDNA